MNTSVRSDLQSNQFSSTALSHGDDGMKKIKFANISLHKALCKWSVEDITSIQCSCKG